MSSKAVEVITTKLPSYLEVLLQESSTTKLVFCETKKIMINGNSQNDTEVVNDNSTVLTETDLELTGTPLQTDLGGDDTVCTDIIKEIPPSWTSTEAQQSPISISDARKFINDFLLSQNSSSSETSIFCICDGNDKECTVGLGVNIIPKKINRFLVYVLPCCNENSVMTKMEYMQNDHIKNVRRRAEIKIQNSNCYNIFGYNLKTCDNLSNVEYYGNISLQTKSNDNNKNISNVKLNLQVVVGHASSPLITYREELCHIQSQMKILENTKVLNESTVINSESNLDSAEITSIIYDFLNIVSNYKKKKCEQMDLKNLRQLTVLDKLWNVLKHCQTLSDLRNCLHYFFEELAEKQTKVQISGGDKSAIAEIVSGILDGRIAVPTLSFSQSLELLIELGLEKLKNDYLAIVTSIYGTVKEAVGKKWDELIYENAQISGSRSDQRRTRKSLNPRAAITDLTSNKLKFSFLDSMHKTCEFMLLYQYNVSLVEESFEGFCESLCNTFIVNFKKNVHFVDIKQPRLCFFNCSISSADAQRFIQKTSPVSSTVTLFSDVMYGGQVVTVFHFSDFPIFPPSIFENYDIQNPNDDEKRLYVTKLVKYIQNC